MCLSFVVEIQRRESYEVKDVRRPGKMMSSPCIVVNLILSYGSKPITAFAIFFVILAPYRFTTNQCTHKEDYSYNSGLHIAFDKDNEAQFFFYLSLV